MATLTPKWRKITGIQGPQPRPRHGHRAAAIKDFIIVFGGGNEGMVEGLYVYNTSKNQWFVPATKGDIPSARAAFGLVVHDNRLLMFGGMLEFGQNCNNLYELQVSRWEWKLVNAQAPKTGSLPIPRFGHSFTLIGEKVYLFGGLWAEVVKKRSRPRYLNDLYTLNIRDIDAPFWEAQEVYGPVPSPRESHSAVAYTESSTGKSLLIVYGGMNGTRLGDVWFLNCNTMSWIQPHISGVPPLPRSLHTSTIIGHKMFIFGGWVPLEPDDFRVTHYAREWKCTNTLAYLDLRTLSWETVPTLDHNSPRPRAGHCAVAALQTRLYIWSGRDGYSKRWNNQICCKDFWFLETEVPAAPAVTHLNRSTPDSLQISWEKSPTAESYLLQIQKYTKAIREPLIISDESPLSVAKQSNMNCNTTPHTTNISCSVTAAVPTFTSSIAVQQLPVIQLPSNKMEPAVTPMKSVLSPAALLQISGDNFGASTYNTTTTKPDQQYLISKTLQGQLSASKIPLAETSVSTDAHSATTVTGTAETKQKPKPSLISLPASATVTKSTGVSEPSTLTINSVPPTTVALTVSSVPLTTVAAGNKLPTTYVISKGTLQVAPVVSALQNNIPDSSLQIISDNNQVTVVTSEASTVNSSSQITTVKPVCATPPTAVSSTGTSSSTSLKPAVLSVLGTNSASPNLEASSVKAATATSTNSTPRKIITILQPRKQPVVQQNAGLPNQAITIKKQEGSATPLRTVLRVSGATNTLPIYRTGTVSNTAVSSAKGNVTQLQIQKTAKTIMTPVRLMKTAEGTKYVVLQTKPGSDGGKEQGSNPAAVNASKFLKIEKLNLGSATISTAAGTTRAIVLKQINVPTSSATALDGKNVNPSPQESNATDTVPATLNS